MKYKFIFFTLQLCIIQFLAFGQTQMKKWWIHNNVINTSTFSINADVKAGTNLIGAANSLYDKNLNLKFYVSNAQIRSANGTLLCPLNIGWATLEYAIVPFIDMNPCSDEKYYVFYHFIGTSSYGLRYRIIQVDKTTGIASSVGNEITAFSGSTPIGNSYGPHGSIAVGKEINKKRYLYYLSGRNLDGALRKFEIVKSNSINSGVSIPNSYLQCV